MDFSRPAIANAKSLFVHEQTVAAFDGHSFRACRQHSSSALWRREHRNRRSRTLSRTSDLTTGDQRDLVDGLVRKSSAAGFETAHAIGRAVERG